MSNLPLAATESTHDSFDSERHENWLANSAGLGAYVHGRVHQEVNGELLVGDPVHKRGHLATDDVLKMEEQALESMGDPLTAPSRLGDLMALAVLPAMSSANGEGDLIGYYENGVVAFDTFKAPRETRVDGDGKVIQKGWDFERLVNHLLNTVSAVSRYAVSIMPRDHFFRSYFGLHFLKTSLGEGSFNPEHLNTISQDIQPLLAADPKDALDGAATGVWLAGGRLLASTGMHRSDDHSATSLGRGFIAINQATAFTDDRTPRAVAEGAWVLDHGMQGVHQFLELGLRASRDSYGFLASDRDADLYFATLDRNAEEDFRDDAWLPIEWWFETGCFQGGPGGSQRRKLAEGYLEGVFAAGSGRVRVLVRTDSHGDWSLWHEFDFPTVDGDCGAKILRCEPLGQPADIRYREASWFQFRVEGSGYAEIRDLKYALADAGSNTGQARGVTVDFCESDNFAINTQPADTRWPVRLKL